MDPSLEHTIQTYIDSVPEPQHGILQELHARILAEFPQVPLSYLDGRDAQGKVVSNPNIGYGTLQLKRSSGPERPFYRVGLSANQKGVSLYFFGLPHRNRLQQRYGATLGKATITGYCIKLSKREHIHLETLMQAIAETLQRESEAG